MFVINVYDAAKILAGIVVLGVVVSLVILPFRIVGDFFFSLGHLGDNGYGPVWIVPAALAAVAVWFAFKRRWLATSAAGLALLIAAGAIMSVSHGMRGDAVAYGSERNVEWARSFGKVNYSALAWFFPDKFDEFTRSVDVDCCSNKYEMEENGDYPLVKGSWRPALPGKEREGLSVFVDQYILHPHTALHDYIDMVDEAGGDWLSYYDRCYVKPIDVDLDSFARKFGQEMADGVARDHEKRVSGQRKECKSLADIQNTFGIDLRAEAMRVLNLSEPADIAAACAADANCRRFEEEFVISLR